MVQSYYQELIAGLPLQVVAIDQSHYTKTVESLARKLHNGDLKPEELDEDLIRQTYGDLTKAIDQSWKDRFKFGDNPDSDRTVLALQRHLFRFSAAKTHSQLQAMNQLLHKDGKLREWADFKKEVAKVNTDFNQNYLQAEFQTARQAGHHARKWQGYVKDKDLFPNLEYQTTADERVRQEHAALDGIIKPVDDPFWDKYYPPNGWRCRCYVVPSDDGVSPERTIPKGQDIKPEFKGNVGKTGVVFGNKHPYFALNATGTAEARKAFEQSKQWAAYFTAYRYRNKTVEVSPFADPSDFKENFNSAKILVDNGISVRIRPHINLPGVKNPEYEINNKLGELKNLYGKNITSHLRTASRQKAKVVVFRMRDYPLGIERLKNQLNGLVPLYKTGTFDSFIIIKPDKTIEIVRVSGLGK